MPWKHVLVFITFVLVCFAFFGLCLDNGFWNSNDFFTIENSILMMDSPSAALSSQEHFKFQPLIYIIHYFMFKAFLFNPEGYFFFNILLHAFNSFLVYLLVQVLLRDRIVSILSGLLFACTVGSYGKSVMIASGFEDLIITTLTLMTMISYFRCGLLKKGKVLSLSFFLTFIFFVASMLTRGTSFAILGAFVAFNFFFRKEIDNKVFRADFMILLCIAIAALIIKTSVFHYSPPLYTKHPGVWRFIFYAGKNVINYLVRMIFPIHTSSLVAQAGSFVKFVYGFATAIRIFLALTVLSYSFFGFIFGNRTIRFFIAWTYIMVLPFAFFQFPYDWLNIRHLYLVSVGFVSVIAAGAVYCSRLIASVKWKRFVPYIVPLAFILMSRFIVTHLDQSYELKAASQEVLETKEALAEKYPSVFLDGDQLRLKRP